MPPTAVQPAWDQPCEQLSDDRTGSATRNPRSGAVRWGPTRLHAGLTVSAPVRVSHRERITRVPPIHHRVAQRLLTWRSFGRVVGTLRGGTSGFGCKRFQDFRGRPRRLDKSAHAAQTAPDPVSGDWDWRRHRLGAIGSAEPRSGPQPVGGLPRVRSGPSVAGRRRVPRIATRRDHREHEAAPAGVGRRPIRTTPRSGRNDAVSA